MTEQPENKGTPQIPIQERAAKPAVAPVSQYDDKVTPTRSSDGRGDFARKPPVAPVSQDTSTDK